MTETSYSPRFFEGVTLIFSKFALPVKIVELVDNKIKIDY
jgi:hypothetical protein